MRPQGRKSRLPAHDGAREWAISVLKYRSPASPPRARIRRSISARRVNRTEPRVTHRLDAGPMTASGHAYAHKQAAERFLDAEVGHSGLQQPPLLQMIQPRASVSSSPDESKLFGLADNNAVANTSRERQRQEGAGQTSHNGSSASQVDDLLPGKAEQKPTLATVPNTAKHHTPDALCAPSRIRTCGLLLRRTLHCMPESARSQVIGRSACAGWP